MQNPFISPHELQKTGYNLIEAIAYGDAAGLPVESMDAADIEAAYGNVGALMAPVEHPYFADETQPGVWSDDTQLSIAVAEALIEADGFDIDVQARHFTRAYMETPRVWHKGGHVARGWGGSTVRSAERLLEGYKPHESGEPNGTGNGVIMKLAPLVLWQAARDIEAEERHAQYDALTGMTHDSDVARWATRVHGDVLFSLLEHSEEGTYHDEVAGDILRFSLEHERALGLGGEHTDALGFLTDQSLSYEAAKILDRTDRKGFYVPQTLAMAYGAFIFLAADFDIGVYEAVNLGGDTDSIASINAAMLNFMYKGDIILPEDAAMLRERERLQRVSKTVTDAALKGVIV